MRPSIDVRPAAALLLAALLSACHGASYWQGRVQADPLYRRAAAARESASCAKLVPMEFGQTVPVPVAGGRFKVLFYPLALSPGKSEASSPVYEASFSPAPADQDVCARLSTGAPASRGPAVPAGTSQAAYYRAEARLFSSLAKAADLYAAGAAPSDSDRRFLADYLDAFQAVAEPGLLPDYYRVNPGFWEWLRRAAGRSIPKPGA